MDVPWKASISVAPILLGRCELFRLGGKDR
jgi:hypothetical protein